MSGTKNSISSIKKIVFTSLFASLIACGSFIAIPLGPVPVTLQNMFAVLSGLVLGPLLGTLSVLLFILAGLLGFPFFSGGASGLAVIMGPTGGYIIGYVFSAFLSGFIAGAPYSPRSSYNIGKKIKRIKIFTASFLGMLIIYIPGLFVLSFVLQTEMLATLSLGFFPFIIGDIVKAVIAGFVSLQLRPHAARHLNSN